MKRKVLIFNDNFLKYSETFIYNQLLGVKDQFEVVVLTNKRMNAEKFTNEKVHEVPFDLLQKVQRIRNPYKFQSSFASKIHKLIQQENPDLIHVHFGHNSLKIIPIAQHLGIPMLVTFWGSDASRRLRDERYVKRLREFYHYPNMICCSAELKNNLKKTGLDVTATGVHYAGVSVDKFSYSERKPIAQKLKDGEKVTFLQVARFVGKKGHTYTMEALHQFLEKQPNRNLFEFRLIGDGPLLDTIMKQVQKLGLSDVVKFLGVKSSEEVQQEMAASDFLLQHSVVADDGDMEGLPIVIMEAMATGLPAVSTYHSGIPELIKDGENGFLVEEKDVTKYAEKLSGLVNIQNNELNKNARQTIEKDFNLNIQNQKLADLYTELMN